MIAVARLPPAPAGLDAGAAQRINVAEAHDIILSRWHVPHACAAAGISAAPKEVLLTASKTSAAHLIEINAVRSSYAGQHYANHRSSARSSA
jgi:uncharacterized membrane protein